MKEDGVFLVSSSYLAEGGRRLDAFEMGRYLRATIDDVLKELFSYGAPWVALVAIETPDREEIATERYWGGKGYYGTERPKIEPFASLWNYLFEDGGK